ncbi:hypothetical protein FNV43_RR02324 [Rhamnella rubrinervis]|uniref:Calcium-transporting ATPase n=1 Tax=Rhamnella rubrinervis TaxID=2594499 RepID=A0A8K0HR99_9ROSA|nr:hypothetical protein FNV43_RR02324 [Rhamnella rubrinervis]
MVLSSIYKKSAKKLFQIHQPTLVQVVKDKDLAELQKLGGVDGVALALKTSADHGISVSDDDEVARRRESFCSTKRRKPITKGFLHYVKEGFLEHTITILMVCALLSLVLEGLGVNSQVQVQQSSLINGVSMFVTLFVIVAVSAVANYKRQKQFERISNVNNTTQVDVVRGGRRHQILISEILVGDVICLKIGDKVPADGLFLQGDPLQLDESSMTGAIGYVEVNHGQNPFLLSGTKVVDGYGRMMVTSVGTNTSQETTPLQARLKELTTSICKGGLAVNLLVLVVLVVKYFTGKTKDRNGNSQFRGSDTKFIKILKFVIQIIVDVVTILVAAIPAGLPMAMTLSFLHAIKRMMAADKVMVKKLSACEIMGSATIICTDKTGTLTMNQMRVAKFWQGKECLLEDRAYYSSMAPNLMELFREGTALNTTGSVYEASGEITGSQTEKAIISWAVKELQMDMEEVTRNSNIVHIEAFNSETKRSGVLTKRNDEDVSVLHVHWKGAAEVILAMCSSYYDSSGTVKDLDDNQKIEFQQIIEGMAASSLRCIAFAHASYAHDEDFNGQLKKDGLVLLGMVGIKDPCSPGAKKAVDVCMSAGVKVKMITGDNVFTAKAIATECGILRPDHDTNIGGAQVIEGVEFRNYSPQERMKKVDKICVMARSSPSDKLLMVQCLKQKGQVVAVIGDGTNDAPALQEADIGLSIMQGTEDAKDSSDIILLNDNFVSVVTVLKWGRYVYNNIEKVIQFQLTVNIAALVISFVATVSGEEVAFTTLELLWVNLIMDTLGALALASDKPTKELLIQKPPPPVDRTEPFITNIMWMNILPQALYQISVFFTLKLGGKSIFGVGVGGMVNETMMFNTFVLCQVFNVFNLRTLKQKNVFKGVLRNRFFMGIIAITIVLQVVMVEFMNKVAGTKRLGWEQWNFCIGIAAMSWPIGWVVKCIPVPEGRNLFAIAMESLLSYLKILLEM